MMNACDGLQSLCVLFYNKMYEVSQVENKGMDNSNLLLELGIRKACNILINFCMYNNQDKNMISDFTKLDFLIEETCLLAIKLSLDTVFIPVRKIIIIFHIYLRYLFGEKKETESHKKFYTNLRYLKEFVDYRQFEKTPRY